MLEVAIFFMSRTLSNILANCQPRAKYQQCLLPPFRDNPKNKTLQTPPVDPTACFKIREVLGVSMSLPQNMTAYQRRKGRRLTENHVAVQVRGGFGEDRSTTSLSRRIKCFTLQNTSASK